MKKSGFYLTFFSAFLAVFLLLFVFRTPVMSDELDDLFDDEAGIEKTSEPVKNKVVKPVAVKRVKTQVSYVEGEVHRRKEKSDWLPVAEKEQLEEKEKVRTLQHSRAEIMLDEEKLIRLAPRTTVDLLKLYREEEQKLATTINVDEGQVWANIAHLEDNVTLSINSRLSAAAVRGTIFSVDVAADNATVIKVYRGQVEVYNPYPRGKTPPGEQYQVKAPHEVKGPAEVAGPTEVSMEEWTAIIVKEMQAFSIGPDDFKPTVADFSLSDKAEQNKWIKWNRERDQALKQE